MNIYTDGEGLLIVCNNNDDLKNGVKILGDDYTLDEIQQWFEDEAQGYADIVPESHKDNFDEYKNVTYRYLFQYIKNINFVNALIYGGGYGTEILPILEQLNNIIILEPGNKFKRDYIGNKRVKYIFPTPSGNMMFGDKTFDLITCLGVLHHVPNVSFILSEFYRVLNVNGYVLIREPITSMHIFEKRRRKGATARERGIPLTPFQAIIKRIGFIVERECVHGFAPITKLPPGVKFSKPMMILDEILCKAFLWNYTYNEYSFIKKFRPTSVSYVLRKGS